MRRVLVTGANGLVGSNLKKVLLKNSFKVFTTDLMGEVNFKGDLKDSIFVNTLPEVDYIINCAAVQYLSPGIPFFQRKKYFYDNNVISQRNIKEKYDSSIKFFIQFGSSMMYKQNLIGEYDTEDCFDANGVYSDSKCQAYAESQKLKCPSALIIPSIIAGKGRQGFFSFIAKMISRFGIVIMPGNCSHTTSVVHVDDVCSLVIKVLSRQAQGIFNADSGENSSISEWVDLISKKLNTKVLKIKIPIKIFKFLGFISCYRFIAKEQLMILGHPHRLNLRRSTALGWKPSKGIQKILNDTIECKLD